MHELLTQFLEHLRYERNVSEHTSRNYQSDVEQFLDYLAPANPANREDERTRYCRRSITSPFANGCPPSILRRKKKASIARKLAALANVFSSFWCVKVCLELNPGQIGLHTAPGKETAGPFVD